MHFTECYDGYGAFDEFGNEKKAEDNGYDLFSFSEKIENAQPIWMCCGRSDSLLDMNRRFYGRIKDRWDVTYHEAADIYLNVEHENEEESSGTSK